jgi:Tol biopolymer transport system component
MNTTGSYFKRLTNNNNWDIEPRVNFSDNRILFISDGSLVISDTTGFNTKILIRKSVQTATWFAENKIIFIWLIGYSQNNGTIWIMNENGSDKKQITYNHGLILEGGAY